MLLYKGSRGESVKKLQQKLKDLHLYDGKVEGVFGPVTEESVKWYQKNNGLLVDGVVGRQTWNSLFPPEKQISSNSTSKTKTGSIISQSISSTDDPLTTPPPQSTCFDVYGDFLDESWDKNNLVVVDLSFVKESLSHVKNLEHETLFGFWAHKLVAPKFVKAFQNIVDRGLSDQMKTFDGCLNKRKMRNSNQWSMHSWGIAVDVNASENPLGEKKYAMTEDLAKCFEDVGFIWGGRWKYPDAMHFQYATI